MQPLKNKLEKFIQFENLGSNFGFSNSIGCGKFDGNEYKILVYFSFDKYKILEGKLWSIDKKCDSIIYDIIYYRFSKITYYT